MLLKIPNSRKFKFETRKRDTNAGWTMYCAGMAMDPKSYLAFMDGEHQSQHGVFQDLRSNLPSPEEEMNKAMAFETLTEEARYVINLILNTPAEAADILFGQFNNRITKARTSRYLKRSLGWPRHRVRKVFREIAEYTRGFA